MVFARAKTLSLNIAPPTTRAVPFVGAAELLRSQPDLIVAIGPEVTLQAVVGASAHIPIVMVGVIMIRLSAAT